MPKMSGMLLAAGLLFSQNPASDAPIPGRLARDAYELYSRSIARVRGAIRWLPTRRWFFHALPRLYQKILGLTCSIQYPRRTAKWLAIWSRFVAHLISGNRASILGVRTDSLPKEEGDIAADCAYRGQPPERKCAPYAGVLWPRAISVPSFNPGHTRALVFTRRWRDPIGGGDEFTEYRKTAAGWRREEHPFATGCWVF
jgi:hypothetical protein